MPGVVFPARIIKRGPSPRMSLSIPAERVAMALTPRADLRQYPEGAPCPK